MRDCKRVRVPEALAGVEGGDGEKRHGKDGDDDAVPQGATS